MDEQRTSQNPRRHLEFELGHTVRVALVQFRHSLHTGIYVERRVENVYVKLNLGASGVEGVTDESAISDHEILTGDRGTVIKVDLDNTEPDAESEHREDAHSARAHSQTTSKAVHYNKPGRIGVNWRAPSRTGVN